MNNGDFMQPGHYLFGHDGEVLPWEVVFTDGNGLVFSQARFKERVDAEAFLYQLRKVYKARVVERLRARGHE